MGSCISKCSSKPKPTIPKECHCVQDKLVITQQPPIAPHIIPTPPKIAPAPPSPSTSTSTYPFSSSPSSSFSCTTTVTNDSKSPLSSFSCNSTCSSSSLTWKDRSYSNEFLWSCVKENPQLISSVPGKVHAPPPPPTELVSTTPSSKLKQSSRPKPSHGARSSSPPLKRQKSFRREPDKLHRSPSPVHKTRTGDSCKVRKDVRSSDQFGLKRNTSPSPVRSSSIRNKENIRPSSPAKNRRREARDGPAETCVHRIDSQVVQKEAGQLGSNQDWDTVPMDDIDNPLIQLDCFIFL